MASALDPYAPSPQTAVPPIPGLDDARAQSPTLVQHDAQVQQLQSEQQRNQQQQFELQHAQELRRATSEMPTHIQQYPGIGWNDLTPEQRGGIQQQYSPIIAGEIPNAFNQAQTLATGRPVGVKLLPGETATAKTGGVDISNIQPTAPDGATTTFDTLAPTEQGMAQAIAKYQYPYQALSRIPGPQRMRVLNAAAEVNPDFDANQYPARQHLMQSFSSGQDANNIQSANRLIQHLDGWLTAGEQLHNRTFTPWNYLANSAEEATGNSAPNTFKIKADAVATELAKLFKGTGGANVQEIKEWRDRLSPNMSPKQIRDSAQAAIDLMDAQLNTVKDKWENGMGTPKASPFLDKQSQQILQNRGLLSGDVSSPTPQSGALAAPKAGQQPPPQAQDQFQPGKKYFDAKGNSAVYLGNGKWQ